MGVAELITRMQEIYRQAEAQLPHVEPLQRSAAAWAGTANGLEDTSALLRQVGGQVAPGWPDEVGALYTERLAKSAQTIRMWTDTLAAADLPATVTALAETTTATVDGVRELWNTFVQAVGQLGIVGVDAAGVEAALQGIVDRAAALLEQLDQRFAEAAAKVAGAADGTAWDGPVAGGAAAGADAGADTGSAAAGGAGPDAAGGAEPLAASAAGGGGGAPAPVVPAGGPGLAGLSSGLPPISPVTPSPSAGLPPLSALAGGVSPVGGLSPVGGVAPVGGLSSVGGLSPVGGVAAAAGGQIPRAGRRLIGAPPLAGGGMAATPGGAAAQTSGATGGSSRFIPPVGGMGHGGGHRDGDVKPGDEKSAYQARPLQAVPGVPPALRGRAGALDATPDFLAGAATRSPSLPSPCVKTCGKPPGPPTRSPAAGAAADDSAPAGLSSRVVTTSRREICRAAETMPPWHHPPHGDHCG